MQEPLQKARQELWGPSDHQVMLAELRVRRGHLPCERLHPRLVGKADLQNQPRARASLLPYLPQRPGAEQDGGAEEKAGYRSEKIGPHDAEGLSSRMPAGIRFAPRYVLLVPPQSGVRREGKDRLGLQAFRSHRIDNVRPDDRESDLLSSLWEHPALLHAF